jgi:glycosyltransferase involved in cell wall biosynthesis
VRADLDRSTTSPSPSPRDGIREVLVTSETDAEFFSWLDPAYAVNWADVLLDVRPDVVHLHHYYHVGLELPLLVNRLLPAAAVVVTLHEFFAICRLSGQMVDSLGHLCTASSPERCARCLGWPVHRTFARRDYLQRALRHVDRFVTPSDFVRRRYVDWGLPNDSIRCVPNVLELDELDVAPPRDISARGLRLAYIGQVTPTKGVDVLVEAVKLARRHDPSAIEAVEVHGGGEDRFEDHFQRLVRDLRAGADSSVRFLGPYAQQDLPGILDGVDAVVVPSVWWENSPVVIEEALARRVPVICSDIGGMAEKIRDGIDGWHFQAGNQASLAELLVRLSQLGSLDLPQMRRPESTSDVVGQHLAAYESALQLSRSRRPMDHFG